MLKNKNLTSRSIVGNHRKIFFVFFFFFLGPGLGDKIRVFSGGVLIFFFVRFWCLQSWQTKG